MPELSPNKSQEKVVVQNPPTLHWALIGFLCSAVAKKILGRTKITFTAKVLRDYIPA